MTGEPLEDVIAEALAHHHGDDTRYAGDNLYFPSCSCSWGYEQMEQHYVVDLRDATDRARAHKARAVAEAIRAAAEVSTP